MISIMRDTLILQKGNNKIMPLPQLDYSYFCREIFISIYYVLNDITTKTHFFKVLLLRRK